MPTVDLLNQTEPEKYRMVVERLRAFSTRDKGVIFLNYSRDYEHQHSLFYDPIHLNADGQRVVTERLIAGWPQENIKQPSKKLLRVTPRHN